MAKVVCEDGVVSITGGKAEVMSCACTLLLVMMKKGIIDEEELDFMAGMVKEGSKKTAKQMIEETEKSMEEIENLKKLIRILKKYKDEQE